MPNRVNVHPITCRCNYFGFFVTSMACVWGNNNSWLIRPCRDHISQTLLDANHSLFSGQAQLLFFRRDKAIQREREPYLWNYQRKWILRKEFSWLQPKGKECRAKRSVSAITDCIYSETKYRWNEEFGQPVSILNRHQDIGTKNAKTYQMTVLEPKTPRCTKQIT